MPPHVFKGLLTGQKVADLLTDVTLLFTDMVGFTSYSKNQQPGTVVHLLSKLFSEFDTLCVKNNVYKVHTIGDCYVIMGYTGKITQNSRDTLNEAYNVVKTGYEMIDIIRRIREEIDFPELDMRIGIHSGSVTAGVIGSNIVRYDIFGADVLVANKMESNGIAGHVVVSEVTKGFLEQYQPQAFRFSENKVVHCQGINKQYKSYVLEKTVEEL